MPTYEYKCDNDHLYIEMRSLIVDVPKTNLVCQVCGAQQRRWFNPGRARIVYKGDGYYFTKDNPPPDGKPVKG